MDVVVAILFGVPIMVVVMRFWSRLLRKSVGWLWRLADAGGRKRLDTSAVLVERPTA